MSENPIIGLKHAGQSVWLDYLSRDIIESGKLRRLIEEDGLSGVTSNPSIFQKAISGSDAYDAIFEKFIEAGVRDEKQLFLSVALEDIRAASDLLWPTYTSGGGHHGFVSIEVAPDLAYDTEATIKEASEIFNSLDRKNILIKVPATKEGLPAIEHLTSRGVNVNVTLLFSVERYREVAEAYMKGLEARLERGEAVDGIHSVASFFVSRVDNLTDKLLEKVKDREKASALKGRAAVANARLAYQEFKNICASDRFKALAQKGTNMQRLLWGSTSTKNPAYSDIKYVEELIAPETVNTMPEETIDAFRDHGNVRFSIEDGLDKARTLFDELRAVGIDIKDVTEELEKDGVKKFSDSYFDLLKEIGEKIKTFHM